MTDTRPQEDPTYMEIVWEQFKKRPLPLTSFYGIIALFLVAVYVPVFISNKPFYWKVGDEPWTSPWFQSLFDRNFFESSLDIAFNAFLFPGTLFLIPVLIVFALTKNMVRRQRETKRQWAILAAALAWVFSFVLILSNSTGQAKVVYPKLEEELLLEGKSVDSIYPMIAHSYRDIDLKKVRTAVSLEHLLGTDNAGRDVFSRLIYGTRISLTIGVFAVAIYVMIGIFIGAIAGYYGGRTDILIQRLIEVVISIPSLFLILTVAAFIEERSIFHIMGIIAAVSWTTPARLVRGEFLRLKNQDFVSSARAAGFKESSIIFRQILPNALGPVLVTATFGVASAILVESTMSFLGLGDITVPSWGQILSTGRNTGSWVLILAPGFAIFLTVSFLNLFGEGLRDALDPKLRK